MKTIYLNDTTKKVEALFRKIAGIAYNPNPGCSMLDLADDVYVGIGMFQNADGSYAYPPAPEVEPDPANLGEISTAMEALSSDFAARMAELQAKIDELRG